MEFSKKTRELSIKNAGTHPGPPDYWWWDYRSWCSFAGGSQWSDTGLIEMQDFAEGTSNRSTKLVHGGLRYLKQFDVEVVSDTVSERAVVQQIAPHIPKPDQCSCQFR